MSERYSLHEDVVEEVPFVESDAWQQAEYYKALMSAHPEIHLMDEREWRETSPDFPSYLREGFSQLVFNVSETSAANQVNMKRDNRLYFLKRFIPRMIKESKKMPRPDTITLLYDAFDGLISSSVNEWRSAIESLLEAGVERGDWEGLETACFALYEKAMEGARTEFKVHLNPTAASFQETAQRLAEFISEASPEERSFIRGFKINCIPQLENIDTYTPEPGCTILPNMVIYFHEEATDVATFERVSRLVKKLDKKMKESNGREEVYGLPGNRTPRFTQPVNDLIGLIQVDSGAKMTGRLLTDPSSQATALETMFDPESNNAFLRTLDWKVTGLFGEK